MSDTSSAIAGSSDRNGQLFQREQDSVLARSGDWLAQHVHLFGIRSGLSERGPGGMWGTAIMQADSGRSLMLDPKGIPRPATTMLEVCIPLQWEASPALVNTQAISRFLQARSPLLESTSEKAGADSQAGHRFSDLPSGTSVCSLVQPDGEAGNDSLIGNGIAAVHLRHAHIQMTTIVAAPEKAGPRQIQDHGLDVPQSPCVKPITI